MDRRRFITTSLALTASAAIAPKLMAAPAQKFKISLAEWSLHKALFEKKMDNLDFARVAREDYGCEGLEYVNQFWKDKATDQTYLKELKKRSSDYGLTNVLIMCDGEGELGNPDETKRKQAVENHYKWVDAAKFLGCHSIRVNAYSTGTWEQQRDLAADGLARLTEYGSKMKINIIVENHGGLSSNGKWLTEVMKKLMVRLPPWLGLRSLALYSSNRRDVRGFSGGVTCTSVQELLLLLLVPLKPGPDLLFEQCHIPRLILNNALLLEQMLLHISQSAESAA